MYTYMYIYIYVYIYIYAETLPPEPDVASIARPTHPGRTGSAGLGDAAAARGCGQTVSFYHH